MNHTRAKVIADSISLDGHRLTTIEVTLHRFVLAELNTHRVFSRNSASSRAIPVSKMLANYEDTPALPIYWVAEKSGMSGGDVLEGDDLQAAHDLFGDIHNMTSSMINAYIERCERQGFTKLHKSLINRLMEPMLWHTVIITSTEWENFFAQRCHPDAQPEMRYAAECIRIAYESSTPVSNDGWHLPYISEEEKESYAPSVLCEVSAARCARVSYLTHDGVRDINKDFELYNKLSTANPPHWSPMEHVAYSAKWDLQQTPKRNFKGWIQMRQFMEERN